MIRKSKDWEIESVSHEEMMNGLDGVKITRRITLRGTAAAAVVLAMGLPGCAEPGPDADESDEEDGKGSKSKEQEPSSESENEGSEQEPTPEQDSSSEKDDESEGEDEPEPEPEEESEEEESASTGGKDDEPDEPDPEEDKSEEEEDEEPGEPITLEEFFDAIMADAQAAVKNSKDDEADYLAKVDKFLKRLDTNVPKISAGNSFNMRSLKKQGPVTIYVMEIRAGAKIPLHNHIGHTGNVLGWRGECTTRNFTKIDGKANNGGFLLQETDSRVITKGKTGVLARVQNNFHILEAGPDGCTLLDVFTYFPGSGSSRYATLSKEPVDKEKKIYEARWSWGVPDLDPRRDFS